MSYIKIYVYFFYVDTKSTTDSWNFVEKKKSFRVIFFQGSNGFNKVGGLIVWTIWNVTEGLRVKNQGRSTKAIQYFDKIPIR